MKRFQIAAALLAFGVAGCSSTNWAPGPDARGTLEEAVAQCRLAARHTGGGFYVQGSEKFVAEASAGYAAGRLAGMYLDYNDCMEASGWVPTDGHSERAAYVAPAPIATASVQDETPPQSPRCTKDDLATADLAKKQGFQYHSACTP